MENISIKLRVANKGLTQVVDYVQGTNTIPIVFDIVDYNIPAGATANIYIKKPSGAQIYNSCSISGNEITVNPTTQMFAESGKQFGQLQILNSEKILESFLILFNIEKSIVDDTAIESSDEFTALEDALNSVDDAVTEAENAVSAANQAVSDAQTAVKNANTAISGANTAASSANSAAESATNAASAANTAAEGANTAAQNANEKASAANSAAEAANNAVDAIEEALQGTVINDNSVSNLTTYSSQKIEGEFDDVNEVIYEIGGRNLILDSENKEFVAYAGSQITIESNITVPEWNTSEAKRAHGTGGTSILAVTINSGQNYPKNGTYCASIYVKNNGKKTISFGQNSLVSVSVDPGSTERVFVAKQQISTESASIRMYPETVGDEFDFIYWHPKIEIGYTPTRWTPAPEDIENEIDGKLSSTGNGSSLTVNFTKAASVSNITSGSTLDELFGQILKNQNDFLDADTIQAAKNAGILSVGGLTLLNSILQLCLENVILEEYDNDIWHVKKYVNGDIEIRGTYITQQQYPITTPYGQIYRYGSDFGISLPEQLINPQDSQAYVSIMSNGTDFAGKVRLENLEQYSNVKFVWLNPTSYTAGLGARIQIFVKGKWK